MNRQTVTLRAPNGSVSGECLDRGFQVFGPKPEISDLLDKKSCSDSVQIHFTVGALRDNSLNATIPDRIGLNTITSFLQQSISPTAHFLLPPSILPPPPPPALPLPLDPELRPLEYEPVGCTLCTRVT